MTIHFIKLLGRPRVPENTVAFRFQRPMGFNDKAGQGVDIALNDPPAINGAAPQRTLPW